MADGEKDIEKDKWDKAKIVGSIALPVVVGIFGLLINSTIKGREIKVEYVRIATGVLEDQAPDSLHPESWENAYRKWAVDVISDLGPRPIPDSIKTLLVNGRLVTPRGATWREWTLQHTLDADSAWHAHVFRERR